MDCVWSVKAKVEMLKRMRKSDGKNDDKII